MLQKLTKHEKFCKQNNQLPTKSYVELKDNSFVQKCWSEHWSFGCRGGPLQIKWHHFEWRISAQSLQMPSARQPLFEIEVPQGLGRYLFPLYSTILILMHVMFTKVIILKGHFHTRAKSRDHEIKRPHKRAKAIPRHLQNHVVWSWTLKCSVKSYVIGPSVKCYFNDSLFM